MSKKEKSLSARSAKIMGWKLKNIPYAYSSHNVPVYKDCWVDKDGEFKYLKEVWRPLQNANQLMMLIEKMEKDYDFEIEISDGGHLVYIYKKGLKGKPHLFYTKAYNKKLSIAVIYASLEAIEEVKGVE